MNGSIAPGDAVQELALSRRFRASRTPVREAIVRLEMEGLLTSIPRRGAVVHQLGVNDFAEINELRILLEPYAARLAALRMGGDVLARLVSKCQKIQGSSMDGIASARAVTELDHEVHLQIAAACGNRRLGRVIRTFVDLLHVSSLARNDAEQRAGMLATSVAEILEALSHRDGDGAEAAVRKHISDFMQALVVSSREDVLSPRRDIPDPGGKKRDAAPRHQPSRRARAAKSA